MHILSRRSFALAGLGAVAVATLPGCSSKDADTPGGDGGKLAVFGSTSVWASVCEAVAGDRAEVWTPIATADQDPHEYEANANDKLKVANAKVALINGGGYDTWAEQLIESAKTKPVVVDAFAVGGYKEGDNEHVFYSLSTAQTAAKAVAKALGEVDAPHKDTYTKNAETFTSKVEELRTRATTWAKANPSAGVISTESVAEYLVTDLGLKDVTPPEYVKQSESEAGPSVAVVEKTLSLIGTEAKVLLVNGQTEDAVSKKLVERAKQKNVKIVKVYETFPEGITDYITFMSKAIDAITA